MKVFRLESKNGSGVYQMCDWEITLSPKGHEQPLPGDPGENLRERGFKADYHHFAFPSINAIFMWFHEDNLRKMKKKGIQLSVYEADEVIVSDSNRQAVFNKAKARLVEVIDVLTAAEQPEILYEKFE